MNVEAIWTGWEDANRFSGVLSVRDEHGIVFETAQGFRNRAEALPNTPDTAFGTASVTKLFTALAACRLVDAGKLSLEDRLCDVLPYDLGQIDRRVTIRHLLTHTSGMGDYLDEEAANPDEQALALYARYPVQLWERLEYYLPMITSLPAKFEPGARFGYSNAGYVMLGLAIESVSEMPYQAFVSNELIQPLGLRHTGFYRSDALPGQTALGYIGTASDSLRTNIHCLPVVGGADGGLYACVADLDALWRALFAGRILSDAMREDFQSPQVVRGEGKHYGLGIYRYDSGINTAFYAVGCDFGVDCFTLYFPHNQTTVSALGNTELSTTPLLRALLQDLHT